MKYHSKNFVNGTWVASESVTEAKSPVTGEVLGTYSSGTPATAADAVAAAHRASEGWADLGFASRNQLLLRVVERMHERSDELARLLTLEQGKAFHTSARSEVAGAIRNLELAIGNSQHAEGTIPLSEDPSKRIFAYRVPRGVTVAIQPWNYPLSIATSQVGPALALGNPVVMLPAPSTSLVADLFATCVAEADLPPGVFNFVTGDGASVGNALTSDPNVAVIAFTGSTATGRAVARSSSGRAHLLLELGGNGPTVVLSDADLDHAVAEALESATLNSGQACTAGELFLVEEGVYNEFCDRFVERADARVRVGDPFDVATTMGPLNNAGVAEKMAGHVSNAVANGASVLTGGEAFRGFATDLYWPVTLLGGVRPEMQVFHEETFGPIAPVHAVRDEAHALAAIRSSRFGLSASVFSADLGRALRFAERVPAGQVNVNINSTWADRHVGFGGRAGTDSGIGRSSSLNSMLDNFTEAKTVYVQL